ncbi:MAG TPA: enoyl-CoA hydratase-related protein [Bryobacteraceae bacterium]|jgi:enoyl-CoA hydratase/carnithine racemase|nr:enoyl-CoA hydratase-related protein [Bryobacteraceae bacterium]
MNGKPRYLEATQHGRVLQITLNRPEKRNALNLQLCTELVEAFDHADTNHTVGAIVINANGPAFCAGMDLKETLDADQVQLAAIHERLFTTIHRVRTPIITAVQGAALAGGTGLVANAHIVFATAQARFGLTEIRIGLWPVLIFRAVEHALGERRTVELSLTGREFSSAEALTWGLVTEIVEDPLARAMDLAATLSAFSPIAVGAGLDYVHQIRGRDWEHAGKVGRQTRDRLLSNEDFKEGTGAFLEKRQPSWPSLKS